jgi:hypothetical protein
MHSAGNRTLDLHQEKELRLDMLALAEQLEVVTEALEVRATRIAQRNAAVRRAMKLAVGDYVMIRQAPQKDRAAKLDAKYLGPWQLSAKSGESGLSFICKMMDRHVRFTTAHVENMKPFHQRPAHLDSQGVHAQLSPQQLADLPDGEKLYRVLNRRARDNGSWEYQWLSRDGTTSSWESGDGVLKQVTPWTLDTFHALYELRYANRLPEYARRTAPKEDASMRKEKAMRIFPELQGTALLREVRNAT